MYIQGKRFEIKLFCLGSYGDKVKLAANYFKLIKHTDWALYQYRVDFSPEEDRTFMRKSLLRAHKEVLGGYIFDGTVLFTSYKLKTDVSLILSH